jgi:hypothetical protein
VKMSVHTVQLPRCRPAEGLPDVPVACPIGQRTGGITVTHGHAALALTCNEPGQEGPADDLLSNGSAQTHLKGFAD